tara:strand:- start:290 stop:772 length:483 start_codon:yes stop_codon:yes gene_type:complete
VERTKNKVIHIFQAEGTLTPPGLSMHSKFADWFQDWSIENEYCILTSRDIKDCRMHIPNEILFKAQMVFGRHGQDVYKYKGLKWMKKVEQLQDFKSSADIVEYLKDSYDIFILYSHDLDTTDKTLSDELGKLYGCQVYNIDEWKDTVLFMKRGKWDAKTL